LRISITPHRLKKKSAKGGGHTYVMHPYKKCMKRERRVCVREIEFFFGFRDSGRWR
jgi:hypothetical protein